MASVAKKCQPQNNAVAEEGKDRISKLPRDLIHLILNGMLIIDAARTSVLSKTWRKIWSSYPYINISKPFFTQLVHNKDAEDHRNTFLEALSKILFSRRGPILDVNLYMPPDLRLHESLFAHMLMRRVSNRGIQSLKITNEMKNVAMTVPSQVFSCLQLKELHLMNCILKPPRNFGRYRTLTVVRLSFVTFANDMSFGAQVRQLWLIYCAGIHHLRKQFKHHSYRLCELVVVRSEMWETPMLDLDFNPFTNTTRSINLYNILGHIRSVTYLTLSGQSLQFLHPGFASHKKLTADMRNLQMLSIHLFNFDNMRQISNALCLIRSSPNLLTLSISVNHDVNPMMISTKLYLELYDCMDIVLDQLRSVIISKLTGSRVELLLIKILLANSPSLTRMTLWPNSDICGSLEEVRILQELLRYPRRSPVQIYWNGKIIPERQNRSEFGRPGVYEILQVLQMRQIK